MNNILCYYLILIWLIIGLCMENNYNYDMMCWQLTSAADHVTDCRSKVIRFQNLLQERRVGEGDVVRWHRAATQGDGTFAFALFF